MFDPFERPSNSQELVGVDAEIAVFDVEPGRRSPGPSAGFFRSVDTGLDPAEFLFVFDARGHLSHRR